MEIPLNAQVECTDGVYGRSKYVLINPVADQVTDLVVKAESSPHTEYIVPIGFVAETIADTIRLRCSKVELEKMKPFIKTTVIEEMVPGTYQGLGSYGTGSYYYLPYNIPEKMVYETMEYQQIPPGEMTADRGTLVEATDGYVGKVDEFVINPDNGRITHLVMRKGHLWGQKDVMIPLSAMGEMNEDTLFLNIDKHQVEALPTFAVSRYWD